MLLRANDPGRRRQAISLTPLIDVVFILLVFFMLASSFLDWREITLGAGSGAGSGSPAGAMLVEIRPEGLRLGGRPAGIDDIGRQVRARLATHPDQRVLVRPAPGVEIQRTVDVLDALRAAGATALVLAR